MKNVIVLLIAEVKTGYLIDFNGDYLLSLYENKLNSYPVLYNLFGCQLLENHLILTDHHGSVLQIPKEGFQIFSDKEKSIDAIKNILQEDKSRECWLFDWYALDVNIYLSNDQRIILIEKIAN